MKNRHDQTAGKTEPAWNVHHAQLPNGSPKPTMENNPLHQLFLDELADLFDAEQQLAEALPKIAQAAESPDLRSAFEDHLRETEEHARRLREVALALGEKLMNKRCRAMLGIVDEALEMISYYRGGPSIDAALIAAAQKMEHYEIASYGTVVAWAKEMGHTQAARLLQNTLEEEKAGDNELNAIAKSAANLRAEQAE